MNANRFPFLDGVRGVAAMFVVMHHTNHLWPFHVGRAYLAVDLFFLLSGFVIGHAYDEKLRTKRLTPAGFMKIRAVRLYPMYFLATLLCIPAVLLGLNGDLPWGTHPAHIGNAATLLALTALMIPFPAPGFAYLFPANAPFWSLFFEMIVNAFYALSRSVLSNKTLSITILAFGVGVILVALRFAGVDAGAVWGKAQFATGLIRAVFGIFLGLALRRCFPWFASRLSRIPLAPWVGMLMVVTVLGLPPFVWDKGIIDGVSVLLLFPCAVALCSVGTDSRFTPQLDLLGRISYPIYVMHDPIRKSLDYFSGGQLTHGGLRTGVAFLIGLSVLCLAVEWLYDIPVRRFLSAKKTGPHAASS